MTTFGIRLNVVLGPIGAALVLAAPAYPGVPGGELEARIALLTLRLAYNVVSGAVTGGTGGIGNP